MLKFLGILAVLYVYHHEIYAVAQKLEFWNPTTEYADARRSHSLRKKLISESNTDRIRLRSKDLHPPKYTMGFRADIKEVVHYPKHGKPHIESILRNGESSSDSDHPVGKTNRYKKHNRNDKKKHNDEDTDEESKTDKSQSREKQKKNREWEKNKIHDKEKYKRDVKDKKHKEGGMHTNEPNHNEEMTHDREKNKEKNKDKTDSKHHKDSKGQEADDIEINAKKHKTRARISEKNTDLGKDVHRIGGPMKMPKLHPEPITDRPKGRVEAQEWPVRHHKSKLRSHKKDDDAHIRSTRVAPLSLMQEDGDGGGGGPKHSEGSNHASYLSPYSVMNQMRQIMEDFPEANATFETIGRTVEYKDIVILKITQKKYNTDQYFRAGESKYIDEVPEKKILFIVHGLSVMGMRSLPSLSKVEELKLLMSYYLKHLDKFDIFLIPMANPDGFSLCHSCLDTLWNKNASPQEACRGVYLDRNFDVAWNASRVLSSCSPLYPGPAPFSEVESKAIRDVFHYFGHKILAYINVHSGTYDDKVFKGEAILFPRGYTDQQSDDDKYIDLRGEIDEAMKNASFQVMSVAVETLYNWYGKVVAGTSVDYASTVYGIPYALEFVMQLYDDTNENMSHLALSTIWHKLIDTTFNNIHKSLHVNDVRRK